MKKTKINIFFESKLIFAKRKEGGLWEEEKRDEKGLGVSESVISEFEEYYQPENLESAIEHPDEIINGVRNRMMQGPLGARNILSGGSILERRVHTALQETVRNAPRLYQQLLSEARIHGITPRAEEQFFSYDIEAGASYQDLLTNLDAQIMALGYIGPFGITDSRGQGINLANPNQTNEFDVVAGAPGVSGNVTVVIRWHQEDLTTIRQKLEQAGMWADFSNQTGAREFLHLKFRQSLIEKTVWKEKTKLSKDKFDPQRLKTWLDDDLNQIALTDPVYVDWFTAWPHNAATSIAALTPAQRNELTRAQREARERVQEQSLEAKLKKILIPGEIENVTKSLETKTMLAYLFYKMSQSNEDHENVGNFIDELAGADYSGNIKTLGSVSERISQFISEMGPKIGARDLKAAESANLGVGITDYGTALSTITAKIITEETALASIRTGLTATPLPAGPQLQVLKSQADILVKNIDLMEKRKPAIEEGIRTLTKEKAVVDKELTAMEEDIVKTTSAFGDYLNEQSANTALWGTSLPLITALDTELKAINSAATPADKITALKTFLAKPATPAAPTATPPTPRIPSTIEKIDNLIAAAKTQIAHFEGLQKNRPGSAGKMDSRGLLYKLVKRDLELKGVSADPNLINESLITTNLLIAQARNQEIYGNVNQSISNRIARLGSHPTDQWACSIAFFNPSMTGIDAIEHVCDTDPDLNKLNGLNINSTPADMIRIMQENKMTSPVKLRELQKKLSEIIRGVEIKGKKIRVIDTDVQKVEKFINNLVLVESRLEAENRLQEVAEGYYDPSKSREEQVLQMLQNQTSDSADADGRIAEELESHDSEFKRTFLRSNLAKEYNEAMNELEGLPKEEIQEELRRRGLTARIATRGLISLRTSRFLKKFGIAFLKYNPATLAGFGLFKAGSWFYDYAKSILWTEQTKERAAKVKERYRASIIEPIATVFVGWPLALGSYIISRPKTWIRAITGWGENKMQ
ncbi:hypothetical protein C0416_05510 [bacterium]|nr:hypothetical protein [bacterium]